MREWVKINKAAAHWQRQHDMSGLRRKINRNLRKQKVIRAGNLKYVQENRQLIESGRHWGFLNHFANLVLMDKDRIKIEFEDEQIVRDSLRNCIDFITPDVPSLLKLAELQCASKGSAIERILIASCLEIMRQECKLDRVDPQLLQAVRVNINVHYSAISEEELLALKNEVDRLIFPDGTSIEKFLRQYIEPQLENSECVHSDIWMLRSDEIFSNYRATLSIEWLAKYENMALPSLDTIFEIASHYGSRDMLLKIIENRCAKLSANEPDYIDNADVDEMRKFWFVREFHFVNDISELRWNLLKSDKDMIHAFHQKSGRFGHYDQSSWPVLSAIKVKAVLFAFINHWPKVDLPNHHGSDSPMEEKAYRLLRDLVWSLNLHDSDDAIPVLEKLAADVRFIDFHKDLSSMYSAQLRKRALRDFEPPTPYEIVSLLDDGKVVTVEGLRQVVIQELHEYQKSIDGGEFNSADVFYANEERLDEVPAALIIAERLNLRLQPQGISVVPEHQLKNAKRCDFTLSKVIAGNRVLLVTEVKGQWHKDLCSAAEAQLHERYSIHPDAAQQGIFLVIWFGEHEKVAGRKRHGFVTAQQLKTTIEDGISPQLKGLIDVFVLDVSRTKKEQP